MELPGSFEDFLADIRLTADMVKDLKTGHETLRRRLESDDALSKIVIETFLQGSYRRSTAVRPHGARRADVDVVVVTNLDSALVTPQQALDLFEPFLDEWYRGKYCEHGRSWGIELSYVDLDLVVTSAPSEVNRQALSLLSMRADDSLEDDEDWRLVPAWLPVALRSDANTERVLAARRQPEWPTEPLLIPDRTVGHWVPTHPIEQLRWTREKNRATNRHYINVVKALKWWRRLNDVPEYPKSYPLEHLIGDHCPAGITSVAQGVTLALESIAAAYSVTAAMRQKPIVMDRGVQQDVFKRLSETDFADFHAIVTTAAKTARRALDQSDPVASSELWRELFGGRFPKTAGSPTKGGFTPRDEPTTLGGGRFA